MKTNIIKEIELKRFRYNHNKGSAIIYQLKNYEKTVTIDPKNNFDDLPPYYFIPVAICSAFESFFRSAIKDLIDSDFVNINRVLHLPDVETYRFDFSTIHQIRTKEISLGEIVAQIITIKKGSINSIFSLLLNIDFFSSLKSFIPAHRQASDLLEYWKNNYTGILKDLNSVYEIRNIICHEFGFSVDITKETLFRYLKNGIIFLQFTNYYFLHMRYFPKEQGKKIKEVTLAKRDYTKTENQFEELVLRFFKTSESLGYDRGPWEEALKNEIELWKKHRKKVAKSNCEIYKGTRNYYTMYWEHMRSLTEEKINIFNARYHDTIAEADRCSKTQTFV